MPLLLVRDVLALARLADAVALDRAREDDRRLSLRRDRRGVGGMHLRRVVSAERELLQLLVRQMTDDVRELRIPAPEMLAEVGAGLDRVLLIFAVDDLAHPLDEQAVLVPVEQRIPLAAPEHLDDVPSGAAERRLELLDDLAVAANGAVEPLQVAVDDEDQVVELFAGREGDGAERFRFIGFAVAEKRPHLRVRPLLETAIFEIPHEPRLVDGADRPEAHRHRREFPEVGHQPRVGV